MPTTLFWLQCGGCGGDTMSLLNLESPDFPDLLRCLDIDVLWHPSMSSTNAFQKAQLMQDILDGRQSLDILCVEGAVIRGPGGTGMYNTFGGKPGKDCIAELSKVAQYVIAVGTCACFGGVTAAGEVEATGLQFHREEKGGFLGKQFVAKSGLPVINLSGCPCHCDVIAGTLSSLIADVPLPLNEYHSPLNWYGLLVHQGCVRNEYHEYRVEEHDFGEKGCLFFHMGCRGPLTYGPCNKLLWNRRSSRTYVGVPCGGCTRPDFPSPYPFFRTRNIAGIPIDLPEGVDRAHYLAYKGMAAASAPKRLKTRDTRV